MYQPRKRRFKSSILWISDELTSMVPPVRPGMVCVEPGGVVVVGAFFTAVVSRRAGVCAGGLTAAVSRGAVLVALVSCVVSGATSDGAFSVRLPGFRFCVNHHA